ncbi:hypothetical protein ACIP4S_13310 [Streptomyces chartreusis]|uniref:hypothetical protein n=1 Tax=Streptomyces chartreusis TaxID=1969 RepID=UPI0037F80C6C
MTDETDVPRPATGQLLSLAQACRPDWSIDELRDVLALARPDMTWGRVLVAVTQLIADPGAEPADLLAARPEAWRQPRRLPPPETAHRGAAAVRAALNPHPESDCS